MPLKTRKLNTRELRVLMALEQKPTGTYKDLADLTKYPKTVVYNIINSLEHPKGRISFFSVVAHPDLKYLGLKISDVFVTARNQDDLKYLDEICLEHPYTAYRALCYGHINGMIIQFRIPKGKDELITELFSNLKKEKKIENFIHLKINNRPIYTSTDVKYWDYKTYSWQYDWNEWFDQVKIRIKKNRTTFFTEKKSENTNKKEKEKKEKILERKNIEKKIELPGWLKKKDIAILAELFDNSRRSNVKMIENLSKKGYIFTPQDFSRRLKRIKKTLVESYRVFIDPKCTDILNPILIWGKSKVINLKAIQNQLEEAPIPFLSTFKREKNIMFWYLHLPSTHISSLLLLLRPIMINMHINYIDHPTSRVFHPWEGTYDNENKKWFSDKNFMVDSVLSNVKKIMEDKKR